MNLNDLKQQLLAKIQRAQKPESPSQTDSLKYAQLRASQESPMKAIIPGSTPDEALVRCDRALQTALLWLNHAEGIMSGNHLDKNRNKTYTGIIDAIYAANTALNHVYDAPDDDIRPQDAAIFAAIDITNDPDFEF
jgi:hypothetical protein